MRVFACVSESVFLKGLESVFPAHDELEYCGGVVDEATLFDSLPQVNPDLLIYDLPDESDLAYLSLLRRNFPKLPVIVLLEQDRVYLDACVRERGAARCLPKTVTSEALFAALGELAAEQRGTGTAGVRDGARTRSRRMAGLLREPGERVSLSALLRDLATQAEAE